MSPISYFPIPEIPLIEPGDDLAGIIIGALRRSGLDLVSGDVLVIAQKVVSKAAGLYVDLNEVEPSPRAREIAEKVKKDPRYVEVVLSESDEVVRIGPTLIVVAHKLGFVMANAGIDESNIRHSEGQGRVLLLPRDPDGSAAALKQRFDDDFDVRVGVIINDSFGRPWRNGVVGVALGAAGVPSLVDRVGASDLFGRPLRVTEIAVADELAAAASLLMGQADEGIPVVLVRGFSSAAPHRGASALIRNRERDLFR